MLHVIGKDVIYCDTDSIKFIGNHDRDFDAINKILKQRAIDCGAYAKNSNGKLYYLGTWDKEHNMTRFKTLGAKKYIYEQFDYNDNTGEWERNIYSTIAGVKKTRGRAFFQLHGFSAFENGTVIENSGHLVAYRNDDMIHKIVIDGCEMTTASNIALVDDTYTLGITGNYLELLRLMSDGIEIIPEGD